MRFLLAVAAIMVGAGVARAAPPTLVYSARYYNRLNAGAARSHYHLYTYTPGRKPLVRQLTRGLSDDVNPQVRGSNLFFVRQWQNNSQPDALCRLDLRTGRVRRLFAFSGLVVWFGFRLSPDGKHAVVPQYYESADGKTSASALYLVDTTGKKPARRLARQTGGGDIPAVWVGNGELLFARQPDKSGVAHWQRHRIEADVTVPSSLSGDLAVSPDGRMAWNGNRIVRLRDAARIGNPYLLIADEKVCWLDNGRLIGFVQYVEIPKQFRVYTMGGTAGEWIPLRVASDTETQAAVEDGGSAATFSLVHPVPSRTDRFVLGTFQHKWVTGQQLQVDMATGTATLWSVGGQPNPSPDKRYFWSEGGLDYDTVATRRGKPLAEGVYKLFVARYTAPNRLVPVLVGKATTGGADWIR